MEIAIDVNGLDINFFFFQGKGDKGAVVLAPAMGMTGKFYTGLANWLASNGFDVIVLDYPGTGLNSHLLKTDVTLLDWVATIDTIGYWVKKNSTNRFVCFIGHSIGSQLFGFCKKTGVFDKAVFIASSTGYWRDGKTPRKWLNFFLLNVVLPISVMVWGYVNARAFRQGENYPKLPALEWRMWCMRSSYLASDIGNLDVNNFNNFEGKITSIWFSDDPIANEVTVPKLASLFRNAEVQLLKADPSIGRVGHMGFISRKFEQTIWKIILDSIKPDTK